MRISGVGVLIGFLVLARVASARAQDRDLPLAVTLSVSSPRGEARLLERTPLLMTISIVNARVQRLDEQALEQWRRAAENAERVGAQVPDLPGSFEVPPEAAFRLAAAGENWLARAGLVLERLDPASRVLFDSSAGTLPGPTAREKTRSTEIVLGRDPAFCTVETGDAINSDLLPGDYRIVATFPDADPDTVLIRVAAMQTERDAGEREYELAEYFLGRGDLPVALEHAHNALGRVGDLESMLRLTLGDIYMGMGDLRSALESYDAFLLEHEASPRWSYPELIRGRVTQIKKRLRIEE